MKKLIVLAIAISFMGCSPAMYKAWYEQNTYTAVELIKDNHDKNDHSFTENNDSNSKSKCDISKEDSGPGPSVGEPGTNPEGGNIGESGPSPGGSSSSVEGHDSK